MHFIIIYFRRRSNLAPFQKLLFSERFKICFIIYIQFRLTLMFFSFFSFNIPAYRNPRANENCASVRKHNERGNMFSEELFQRLDFWALNWAENTNTVRDQLQRGDLTLIYEGCVIMWHVLSRPSIAKECYLGLVTFAQFWMNGY